MLTLKNTDNGFSIVEIVVAIAIGSLLVIAVSQQLNTQSFISQNNKNVVLANAFAEEKIEELRSVGYLGINNTTVDITSDLPSDLTGEKSASYTSTETDAGLKNIRLTITYNDRGRSNTVVYTTVIGELGVGQY